MALRAPEYSGGPQAIAGLPTYWTDASKTPTLEWEKWIDLFEVALMAKNNISVSELTKTTGAKEKSLMGDLDEIPATKKAISVLYLALGAAGRKTIADKFPTTNIATVNLTDLLKNCKECFEKPKNETLDRLKFLSRKQKEGESLKQFWNELNGLASKCNFGAITESLVKDVFIVNMNNKEVQQKLCTEPKTNVNDNIQFAIAYEEGTIRQQSFETLEKPKIKAEPSEINNINQSAKRWGPQKKCFRCEGIFTPQHLKECKAIGITCMKCGKKGHFAKCCQTKGAGNFAKSRKVAKPPQRIQRIDEWSDSENEGSIVDEEKVVLTIEGDENGHFTMKGKINGNEFQTMVDSGSPVTIFEIDELKKIMKRKTLFIRELLSDEEYVDFNRKKLELLGYIFCHLEVGESKLNKARILIAQKGAKSLIGRDWLNAFNYKFVSPNQSEGKQAIYKISSNSSENSKIEKENEKSIHNEVNEQTKIKEQFNELFTRQGKLIGNEVKIEFKPHAKITQQKGRRVPIQLQDAVQKEIERLLHEGHIERVKEVTDKQFIQPIVITVKRDKSVKIALDARALNKEVVKDKYQMPNLEHLVDMVAEQLDTENEGIAWYTSLDMQYAYGQVPLNKETAKHCNFQIIGGKATGTYKFVTGFYGLTVMPTEFQKAMDTELANIPNTYVFLDDILVVTKGSKENHYKVVETVLTKLNKANVRLKWEKCNLAQNEIEWLGYKLTQNGISPINTKIQAITQKLRPENLKELRSYLRAVNQMNRFIPNLAQLCFPLRPLLKKDKTWNWEEKHEKAFKEINEQVKRVTEVGHFKKSENIRIVCDASKAGLGAVLQQQDEIGWRPIHFASRFLTPLEENYSINELELLAVVWAIEHFKNYLYGIKFQVVSDHKALATVLKGNKGNKTYSNRLTRWVDRLLPFDFDIFHAPGRTIGIADYLSRHPSQIEGESVKAKELWNNWFTVNHVNNVNSILAEEFTRPIRGRQWLKLNREDRRSKSEQTHASKQTTQLTKMGQNNSTNALAGKRISKQFESKVDIAKKIGENMLIANYNDDENVQKLIKLVKSPTKAKIKALESPWRERFNSISIDENNLLYMDDRLIIPKNLQTPIKNSLHWGHTGRD